MAMPKPWGLIILLVLLLTSISAYTDDAEPTVNQLKAKLAAAEDMAKMQKTQLESKVSNLVKEKEELNKTIDSNKKEIDKLNKEIEKLKKDLDTAKPVAPIAEREQPKPIYKDLKFRNFAVAASYKTAPNEVFPKLIDLVKNITVANTSESAENKTTWTSSKKEITMGFGGKGGTVTFNINDENQKDINDRFKVLWKHATPGSISSITMDKLDIQTEFPNMTPIQSCSYKETATSEPIKKKLQIQHHYFSKVNVGQGMVLVLVITPEEGFTNNEDIIYVVSIVEVSDINSLRDEISAYYDKVDMTKLASSNYDKRKAAEEERRKSKGLLTLEESQKAAGIEPTKPAVKEPKRDPWTREIIKEDK